MENIEQLIKNCIAGNRKSQKRLYDMFASKMMVVSYRYSKSKMEAEDILQEAFIKVFKNLEGLRDYSNIGGWVKRIVINTALNYQRSKLYLYPMVDVSDLKMMDETHSDLANYHFKELIKMIQELPLGCQVIFNLYAIEGYTHKEIAEKLQVSEGTSKSQYARARFLLQQKLEEVRLKSNERF